MVCSSLSLNVCAAGVSDDGSSGSDGSDMPVLYASPTETMEHFTMEETIALIVGSDVSYSVHFEGETENYSGKIKPVYVPYDSSVTQEFIENSAFIYFPIPGIRDKKIVSLDLVFSFPFTVQSLSSLYFGIAPSTYSSSTSGYSNYFNFYYFTYQIDNTSNPVGSQVVDSFSIDAFNRYYVGSFKLSDSLYALYNSNGSSVLSFKRDNLSYYFGSSNTYENFAVLNGDFQDIDTFGFSWSAPDDSRFSQNLANFKGIGFIFAPMTITYASGGGYNPDVVLPDDPIIPDPVDPDPTDPTEPTKGEYADQLDNIYNKLVEQGQIQQAQNDHIIQQNDNIINQNQQIIDGQQQQIENDQKLWDDTFNPTDEDVGSLGDDIFSEDLQNQVKEKLGLFTFIDDTLQKLLDVFNEDGGSTSLRFPGLSVTVDGTAHQVIEPYDFDIKESLKDFDFLVNAIRFVNGIIIILGFLAYLNRLKVRFLGND